MSSLFYFLCILHKNHVFIPPLRPNTHTHTTTITTTTTTTNHDGRRDEREKRRKESDFRCLKSQEFQS